MDQENALKSLEIIRNVILQTKREVSESGPFLIWWGSLILITAVVSQGFSLAHVANGLFYGALWGSFNVVGWTGQVIMGYRLSRKKAERFSSLLGKKIALIWVGIVTGIVMMVVLSFLKVFSPVYIWPMTTLLAGIGIFTTGILLSDRPSIFLGILILPVVIMMVRFPIWQSGMFALFFGGGLLGLGLLWRKEEGRHGNFVA